MVLLLSLISTRQLPFTWPSGDGDDDGCCPFCNIFSSSSRTNISTNTQSSLLSFFVKVVNCRPAAKVLLTTLTRKKLSRLERRRRNCHQTVFPLETLPSVYTVCSWPIIDDGGGSEEAARVLLQRLGKFAC